MRARVGACARRNGLLAGAVQGLREHCAVLVQKVFRGAHSRKYKHDFYARKGYIEEVGRRSEAMRRELQESKEAQIAFLERKAREKADKEFETLAQNFHHLVSTAAIPGVFNPPFAVNSEVRALPACASCHDSV